MTTREFTMKPRAAVGSLKRRAMNLAQGRNDRFLDLASVLSDLQAVDPRRFRSHIEEIGISQRKAYYLVSLFTKLEHMAPLETLEKVGWTKLAIVAPHINKSNAKRLLNVALERTARGTRQYVNKETSEGKTHCMLLYFNADDYAIFADAIVRHGGSRRGKGLIGAEKALLRVIARADSV